MTTTTTVECSGGVWTPVSSGSANVTVQMFSSNGSTPVGFRIVVADTPPDNSASDLGLVSSPANGGFAAQGLAVGTDNVYVRPLSGDAQAQVIAS